MSNIKNIDIQGELVYLKDLWRDKPRKGKKYKKDQARYWKLKAELQMRQAEEVFEFKRQHTTSKALLIDK